MFVSLMIFSYGILAKQPPLTLDDLNNIRQVKSAQISPNGKHIAFVLDVPDNSFDGTDVSHLSEIYLVSRKGVIKPLVTGGAPLGLIKWSNDNKHIYYLSKKEKDKTVSLYNLNIDEGIPTKRFAFATDIIGYDLNHTTQELIFWATKPQEQQQKRQREAGFDAIVFEQSTPANSLYRVDLKNDNSSALLVNDSTHILKALWLEKSQNLLIKHARSANTDDVVMGSKLSIMNLAGETIQSHSPEGKMEQISLSPDEQHVVFIGNNDNRDPSGGRLWILPLTTFKPWQLVIDYSGHFEHVGWLRDDKVAFIVHKGMDTILGSTLTKKPSTKFKTLLKNAGTLTALDIDERGRNIALISHTAKHPKELFWYTRDATVRITDSNPWLKNRQLAKQKEIKFTATDGTEIQALVIPPINNLFEKPPGIIFVHGGPETHVSNGWNNRYSSPVSAAAEKGFLSIIPNYRGSTGRGVAFSKLGQNDYAGKEFDDLLDARQWMIDSYDVDAERIGITGTSYGGYAAAWAATKHHRFFAASVSGMGIANQISKYGVTDIPTEMIQLHSIVYPWDDWTRYLKRSPIFHTKEATTPLLLLHGEKDKRVPASQSIELFRYFTMRAKAPTRLVLYPEEGHGFVKATAKLDYSTRLMRWMEHFLIYKETQMPPYQLNIDIPKDTE